jgi:hypothetical protein
MEGLSLRSAPASSAFCGPRTGSEKSNIVVEHGLRGLRIFPEKSETRLVLAIAKNKADNKVDDDTEFYDGELKETIEAVTRSDARRNSN